MKIYKIELCSFGPGNLMKVWTRENGNFPADFLISEFVACGKHNKNGLEITGVFQDGTHEDCSAKIIISRLGTISAELAPSICPA